MKEMLGKDSILKRIRPLESCREAPAGLRFVDWTERDGLLTVRYSFFDTAIGRLLIADTPKGVCFLGFVPKDDAETLADLRGRFPGQPAEEGCTTHQQAAADRCNGDRAAVIPLHLKGTPFQLGIWEKLTRIPQGALCTYASLSDDPKAARAVGAAVGANPVSYLVPCHRVVRKDGSFHGYHWGTQIKIRLLEAERQPFTDRSR